MSIDIKASRAICDGATPGPWYECGIYTVLKNPCWVDEDDAEELGQRMPDKHDAHFICYARTALPAALDEIERLRAALKPFADEYAQVKAELGGSTADLFKNRKRAADVLAGGEG